MATKRKAVVMRQVKQKAPSHTINNMLEIEKHFNERILDQATSIRRLSVLISTVLHNSKPIMRGDEALLYMITIAGPRGTGKTETVTCLKHFMGMDEDYEYAEQFIEYDAASGGNTSDMMISCDEHNKSGSSASDSQDVITRLNRAVESHEKQTPPYIMLYVNEYEHSPSSFKFIVNSLISTGQYKTSQGVQFALPKETSLLVVCTSHCGDDDIMEMEERCDDAAKQYIRRAMEQSNPNVQRRNLLLPYYPLSPEVLKELLANKLERYITCSRLLKSLGIEVLTSTQEMKEMLIKHVLLKIDKRYGMHSGERMLKDKLDVMFETGRAMIELDRDRKKEPIFLDSFTLDTQLFGAILEKELVEPNANTEIIRTIRDNPENKQYLARCDPSLNGIVEAVGMRYGAKPVCGLIMNVTYINITNIYETDENTKRLKQKNKLLKSCITAIGDVVEKKDSHNTVGDILKNYHDLLNESSDDSDDAARHSRLAITPDELKNKRKVEDLEVSTLSSSCSKKAKTSHTSSSSSSSSFSSSSSSSEDEETREARIAEEIDKFFSTDEEMFSDSEMSFSEIFYSDEDENEEKWQALLPPKPKKRGRPVKTIEGFKRVENSARNVSYVCLQCEARISKPCYANRHQCRK